MKDDFVNLHVHSHYSLLDGLSKPSELAERAAELGQPAVSITDHGSLGGAMRLWEECNRVGIKPIIGLEAYAAPGDRTHREVVWWGTPDQRRDDLSGGGKYTHLTLFAQNAEGLRNLYRLHKISFAEGFYLQPRIDLESVAAHSAGIIATTGCPSSAIQTRIRLGQFNEALAEAGRLKDIFGERLYVEIMDHEMEDDLERRTRPDLLRIHDILKIPLVVTTDSHYTLEQEGDIHDSLLCIQTKAKKSDQDRFRFNGHGYHLRTSAEMVRLLGEDYREGIRNTVRIADSVEDYSEMFTHRLRMPTWSGTPEGDNRELRKRVTEWGLDKDREILASLNYEIDVISSMGYSGYFLVLSDILRWGRDAGIRVGPGRGSAGGSFIPFALGITEINPREHGLLFERFLNPERISLPDVDVDVDDAARDLLLDIIRDRIGQEKVAQLGTFGTIGAKSALKDSARALGYPYKVGVELAGKLPPAKFGRQPTLSELPSISSYKEVQNTARGIEGTIRSKGVHAAGVVISPDDLADIVPIYKPGGKKPYTTMFDMRDVEKLGLVKYDFLGLATLGVIDECIRSLSKDGPYTLPTHLNDEETYRLLSSAETLGVFQLDGWGMRSLLRRLRPSNFDDITAVLALYRPGPMGANAHTEYANRKNGKHGINYPHPEYESSLAAILSPTYGIIVYQEQVLKVLAEVGGYTYSSAALIFDAMRKKDTEKMEAARPEFVERLRENGYSDGAIDALWEVLVPFADYSFNKSHSVGYGIISYWTAYLKAHHPKEFMCALLTREGDPEKLHEYIYETVRLGISILPPDVNESDLGWTITNDGIRFGWAAVKGVGAKAYAALDKNRPYKNLNHFFRTVDEKFLNIGVLKSAIQCGALDSLEPDREGLLREAESLAARALADRDLSAKGQTRLWGRRYRISVAGAKAVRDRRTWETETLGIALTQQRVRIRLRHLVSENELYYIRRVVEDHPGRQPIDLEISPSTILHDLATMDLSPSAIKRLEVLGSVDVGETE